MTGARKKTFNGLNKSYEFEKSLVLAPMLGQESVDSSSKLFILNKIYLQYSS